MSDPVLNLGGDVIAAIQKNLPSVTAGVLTERLKQADRDVQTISELKDRVREKDERIAIYVLELARAEDREKLHGELLKREKDVAERERLQDLAMATVKLQMQTERINALEGLVSAVFRNKTLVETINRTVPIHVQGSTGSGGYVGSGQESGTRTVSDT